MAAHLIPLTGDWALWRDLAVRSAGFPVSGLDVFGAEDEGARLSEVAEDPLFREAVIWQNRQAFRTQVSKIAGLPSETGSKRRQREAVVASYWQRYCSKNDTIGFFGPLAWGQIRDGGPPVAVRSGGVPATREVHFETWCLQALATRLDPTLHIPVRLHPERELRERLERMADADLRERGIRALDQLESARDAVAGARGDEVLAALDAFDEVFMAVTGQEAARPDDQAAGGRTPLYLDCTLDLEVDVGPALVSELAGSLPALLESARWYCGRAFAMGRRIIAEEFGAHSGTQELAPAFGRVSAALLDMPRLLGPDLDELQRRWRDLLSNPDQAPLAARAAAAFADHGAAWANSVYHSPDVQIAAGSIDDVRGGKFLAVVGDFHPGGNALLQGVFATQHPDPEALRDQALADLGSPRLVLIPRRAPGLPLTARVAPASFTADDVHVVLSDDDRPAGFRSILLTELLAEGDECTDREGSFSAPLSDLFALPIFLAAMRSFDPYPGRGAHAGRITVGRTVLRRETWASPAGAIPATPGEFTAWAQDRGMPRRLFCRPPGEEKPVYVDVKSPLLMRTLQRMLARTAAAEPGARILFTEMLPGPDECWLEHDGDRYTSEFRLVAVDLTRRGVGRINVRG